ncbi:MAG: hypothetical protein PHQ58_00935 [Rhodoferax sp.]|uniref:EF-hand domain-containing protein n=1 Tax=Rhodoferax sp. TaxID=50421 RepID=UPI00260DBBB8|nr:EF-hand domain-containing protein [Rhodoferax sp.]MDD2878976.1 hypothetical protein [Rhodoferax sp.]
MSSISGVSASSNAWANANATTQRSQMQAKMFSKVDNNSDGSVDQAEMTAFTDKMKAATGQDSATSFAKLDTDSNGKLTQAEFEAGRPAEGAQGAQGSGGVKGAGGPPPPGGHGGPRGAGGTSETSSSFDPLDTNQDGTVSQLEKLAGALKEFVNSADATSSGSSASDNLMQLAKQIYEQISSGNTATSASTLDAVA